MLYLSLENLQEQKLSSNTRTITAIGLFWINRSKTSPNMGIPQDGSKLPYYTISSQGP